MNMSANNAKHANSTCKKSYFALFALFADSYPLSEIRARKVEACAVFPSEYEPAHTAMTMFFQRCLINSGLFAECVR